MSIYASLPINAIDKDDVHCNVYLYPGRQNCKFSSEGDKISPEIMELMILIF